MLIEPLVLRPDASKAIAWGVLSVVVLAMGAWITATAGTDDWVIGRLRVPILVIGCVLLGLSVAVGLWFWLQALAPNRFEVRVLASGIHARTGWLRLDVPWDRVESVTIRLFAGESYLRVNVIDEVADGWLVTPRAIPLPVGSDTAALRMALARARAVGRFAMEAPAGVA